MGEAGAKREGGRRTGEKPRLKRQTHTVLTYIHTVNAKHGTKKDQTNKRDMYALPVRQTKVHVEFEMNKM